MKVEGAYDEATQSSKATEVHVGPTPMRIKCVHCQADMKTRTHYVSSMSTHVVAAMLVPFCCCCLPYICISCKNVVHICGNCSQYLDTYRR